MVRKTSKRKKGRAIKAGHAKRSRVQLKNQERAAELAGQTLDRLVANRSATTQERDSRKRKLLKGPKEFRDLRRDQRK
jgi:hypothetical protein